MYGLQHQAGSEIVKSSSIWRFTTHASETETPVRQWQDTRYEDWVREPTPDTISPDGEGVPPVQTIVRELRSKSFPYIRLDRDSSTEVSKDAALRVLVAAANGNEFVNDAAENLDLKPWYDGSEVPTGQTLLCIFGSRRGKRSRRCSWKRMKRCSISPTSTITSLKEPG